MLLCNHDVNPNCNIDLFINGILRKIKIDWNMMAKVKESATIFFDNKSYKWSKKLKNIKRSCLFHKDNYLLYEGCQSQIYNRKTIRSEHSLSARDVFLFGTLFFSLRSAWDRETWRHKCVTLCSNLKQYAMKQLPQDSWMSVLDKC